MANQYRLQGFGLGWAPEEPKEEVVELAEDLLRERLEEISNKIWKNFKRV